MVDTFVRFDDACSSYDDDEEDDSRHNSDGPGGPSTVRSDVSERSPTPPDDAGTRETTAGDEKRSNTPWAETMKLPVDGEWCSKSAKHFYRCLRDRLDDQQLVAAIDNYIEANCYRSETDADDDGGGTGNTFPEKRDWPKYVSKQKFHSWGGKRNAGQVFYPWGGKRTAVPRAHKQPKVVIRNPFHSWGGKRSDLAVAVMA
ncbi:leucokinins-like [Anopheles cruzii]|uniref:leucokinins-like n=1 Tax=Anopheles cruzii TaxID=68878 RepID=UPI0022EC69F5|nr:leucokinins-like [Anopheles cruzii]